MYSKHKVAKKKEKKVTRCIFDISVFTGTWFENSKVDIADIGRIFAYFLFLRPPHIKPLCDEVKIHRQTAVDWTSFCSEVRNFTFYGDI